VEAILTYSKILTQHLPGATKENHEKPVRMVSLGCFKLGPPEYEGVTITQLQYLTTDQVGKTNQLLANY
jgi:hypothetical protein